MKKLILLTVTLLMTLSLAACDSKGNETYAEFLKANEKMAGAESMDMDMDIKAVIEADGQSMDMKMKGNMKQIMRSETDIDMEMDMNIDMTIPGMGQQKMDSLTYFKDGYLYTSGMGQKVKMAMDIEEMQKQSNLASTDFTFEEKAVKSSSMKEVEGGKELSFTLDGKTMSESLSEMMGSMSKTLPIDATDMNFGDMEYVIVVDNDSNMKNMAIKFDANMDIEGQKMTVKYDITAKVNQINNVTIDFPSDLDTYPEATL